MDALEIRLHEEASPRVLSVGGELDVATADQLRAALEDALSRDGGVVVDMAGVTFVDAAGLRVILQTAESLEGDGALTLVNAGRVAWLLEIVGLKDVPSIEIREGGEARGR